MIEVVGDAVGVVVGALVGDPVVVVDNVEPAVLELRLVLAAEESAERQIPLEWQGLLEQQPANTFCTVLLRAQVQ